MISRRSHKWISKCTVCKKMIRRRSFIIMQSASPIYIYIQLSTIRYSYKKPSQIYTGASSHQNSAKKIIRHIQSLKRDEFSWYSSIAASRVGYLDVLILRAAVRLPVSLLLYSRSCTADTRREIQLDARLLLVAAWLYRVKKSAVHTYLALYIRRRAAHSCSACESSACWCSLSLTLCI